MHLACISDTHGFLNNFKVPDGDVLIHASDLCNTGIERDVHKFAKWFTRAVEFHDRQEEAESRGMKANGSNAFFAGSIHWQWILE